MTELARLVAAVVRDRAVEEALEENRRLLGVIEEFRRKIRHVQCDWAGPSEPDDESVAVDPNELDVYVGTSVDLSSDRPDSDLVRLGPEVTYFVSVYARDFHRTEIRFGDFSAAKASAPNLPFYVHSINCDRDNRQLRFFIRYDWEWGATPAETITIRGFIVTNDNYLISIEQYSEFSGLSVEQIQAKYSVDELEDGHNRIDDESNRFHIHTDVLQRTFGRDC